MADAISVSGPISGTDRTLTFETGKLAQLADGAVLARIGDTVLLATATAARSVREGTDFFPLTVDIEERAYAAGKIPGSFFRREGKSSDQAILTCRLIDRPLRPSFPDGFRNEVHVVGTIFGADQVNPHDVLAINASSAALMLSGIPFDGPIGAVRVAYTVDGTWIPHPTFEEGDAATFELVVAGRALTERDDTDIAIMMVEAGGTEKSWSYYEDGAPKVTEEVLAEGLEASKTWIRESILLQRQLVADYVAAHGAIVPMAFATQTDYADDVWARVEAVGTDLIAKANTVTAKAERNAALDAAGKEILAALADEFEGRAGEIKAAIRSLTKKLVRQRIIERRPAHGRSWHGRHPAPLGRDRPLPDGPRLGALPARRDPGPQRDDAGHAPHEPAARHHHPGRPQALHAPLQLPALLHRRDRLHARPQASGDRPRPAGRAGPAARRAQRRGVPLHAAPGLRRARLQRVDVHGVGLRLDACR